jgi:hypothetical protein
MRDMPRVNEVSNIMRPSAVTDQMWIDAARVHFRGEVTLGKDLLEI